jgi:hypothetical protein
VSARREEFESARGGVPADEPEVAERGTPVEDHAPSHAGERVPVHGDREEKSRPLNVLGKRQRKTDGLEKSTGRARYTDDLVLPGMLHGKILRSPHPHARILSIDASEALALPGVHGVVTGAEMPIPFGIIVWTPDEQALATDRVRYVGDAVAAVAAVDEDTANRALALIRVEYEVLEAIFDPHEAARRTDVQIHEAKKPGHNGNISKIVKLDFGEVDRGLAESDVVIEGDYFFEGTTHTPIEPHCAIGQWEEGGAAEGRLTVWSSTQVPALPAPRARARAGAGRGPGAGDPAAVGGGIRREERALRPGVLRREAGDEDRPAGEDPLHARGGVLRPPRPPSLPHAGTGWARRRTAS